MIRILADEAPAILVQISISSTAEARELEVVNLQCTKPLRSHILTVSSESLRGGVSWTRASGSTASQLSLFQDNIEPTISTNLHDNGHVPRKGGFDNTVAYM